MTAGTAHAQHRQPRRISRRRSRALPAIGHGSRAAGHPRHRHHRGGGAPVDVDAISVVPMRLTGPGSEHPPTADLATRSTADRQLFSANLWLMERGSMQVRVTVAGKKGPGVLSVPVPAASQTTLSMPRGLGALMFGLMALLACAIVDIVVGALREATLPAGAPPTSRRRGALIVVAIIVGGAVWLGNMWWTAVAADYARMVHRPWHPVVRVDGCKLTIADEIVDVLADHGHDMHLFLVRAGAPRSPGPSAPDPRCEPAFYRGAAGIVGGSLPPVRRHRIADGLSHHRHRRARPCRSCTAPRRPETTRSGPAPPAARSPVAHA